MRNIKCRVAYEGTRYQGWQRQESSDNTIQGKLEQLISRMCNESIEIQGSGRTDAGVHSMGQIMNFHTCCEMDVKEMQAYMNQYLPEDIAVVEIEEVPERFHSRLSAVGKTYSYRICTSSLKPIFDRKYVWWLPEKLDIAAMRQAAGLLVGTHDFASFCGNPRMKKSTVRTVDSLEIREERDGLVIVVHGDGFLQNMVRILTGTLVEVGRGKMRPEAMTEILAAKKRAAAGPMAPPQGLCLEQADYH